MVCRGFKGDHVYINDPARGSTKIAMDEFKRSYGGIVLFFVVVAILAPFIVSQDPLQTSFTTRLTRH